MSDVFVPRDRLGRWLTNFTSRHGDTTLEVVGGTLTGRAADGSMFTARLPFGAAYDGPTAADHLVAAAAPPPTWGVLLVRKGGFAVARLDGPALAEHKIGQRHVQGRTKAGGQSQQRFARRRDNQARQAYEAAADHAAVDEVLADPRLRRLTRVEPWLAVPDPRRAVLDQAIADACSLRIDVVNA
jgi:hypothetical protein